MFHVIIPARFAASRLPGKPLLTISGRPMVQWVWERARASGAKSVLVATDDERIRAAARGFGADCVMTSKRHASGTDRIAEAVRAGAFDPEDIVVNVQGDEPMIPSTLIADIAAALEARPDVGIASAVAPITSMEEFMDTGCVKALRALDGRALYFSRAPVPWPREDSIYGKPATYKGAWRHVGIYAYRVRSLLEFAAWEPSDLEMTERLEQLRALERGMSIHLVTLGKPLPAGVDTQEDLERVRAVLAR
jgi:3-deoxy-manno-octulosonate cytidylyltransferase (CMP-KDO synthetase)